MIYIFSIAHAQTGSLSQINNANDLVMRLLAIGNVAIYVLTAFAVLYIVYMIVIYFIKGKEGDESRHDAGMRILYGIIGLFVIVSLWGLVNILLHTFGTDTNLPVNRLPSTNFLKNDTGSSQNQQLYDAPSNFGQQNQGLI